MINAQTPLIPKTPNDLTVLPSTTELDQRMYFIIKSFDNLNSSLQQMSTSELNSLLLRISSKFNPENAYIINTIVHCILQNVKQRETIPLTAEEGVDMPPEERIPTHSRIDSLKQRVFKITSENPAKLLLFTTLLLQAIEAPILDKLIQDILSIKIINTSTYSSSSSSLVLPDTLIKFSVLEVCITLIQIVASASLFRKFSLNMRNNEFDSAMKLASEQNSLREIIKYSNQSPIYIWRFVAYAASAMTLLIASSTMLATVLSKMQSGVVFETSSNSGDDPQLTMGLIVNENMVRGFGALTIFSLKHVILSVCAIFKLWENKFEVVQGMRTADAVSRFV